MERIAIIAGESSGDAIGNALVTHLRSMRPNLQYFGIAGPLMRSVGVTPWFPTEKLSIMGFTDVLKKAFSLHAILRKTVHHILQSDVKAVVTIDQPSFSIALAKRLKAAGYAGKMIQIVAPSVWAYNPKRTETVASSFDLLLLLYRFELDYFTGKLPCEWVGHPLIQSIPKPSQEEKTTLALFPGSRPGEIKQNLPLQLAAASTILKQFPQLAVGISVADGLSESTRHFIEKTASKSLDTYTLAPYEERYALMQRAKAALTKSGTVTLELALLNVPFVCCYKVGKLTELYARYILKIPPISFALPNILARRSIFPECIIPPVSSEDLVRAITPFLSGERKLPDLACLKEQIDPEEQPGARMATAVCQSMGWLP